MSRLFKDSANGGLARVDHSQSNSKKMASRLKRFVPQMKFFLKKLLIKFSCTYQSLSFCKIFKKFLEPIQSYEDVPFSGPKWPICPEQIFLVQTIIITFIYLLALFIVQNLKKFLQQIQSYEDVPFLGPKWSICPKQKFFLENY